MKLNEDKSVNQEIFNKLMNPSNISGPLMYFQEDKVDAEYFMAVNESMRKILMFQ